MNYFIAIPLYSGKLAEVDEELINYVVCINGAPEYLIFD